MIAQSYERWELIIINDGGPDIVETVEEHNRSGRLVYLQLPQSRGAAAARNAGIAIARGTYIAYLDDDDWYDERHISKLVNVLEQTGHAVAYSDSRRVIEVEHDGTYRPQAVEEPYYAVPFSREALLVNNYIPILAIAHRRDLLDEVGAFDESLEVLEDWELWVRMSQRTSFVRVPEVTCNVRWRNDQTTTTTGRRRDHYPCAKRIHDRYAEQAEGQPQLLEARAHLLKCLEPEFRSTPPTCTIVIASTNEEGPLRECLEAIASVTQGVSYDVVVVDNGSSDGTARMMMDVEIDAAFVVLPNRVPVGEALQRGAQQATGRFLLFMSPDDIVREYWLRALVEDAELHADAVVVSSKLLDLSGTVADAGCMLTEESGATSLAPRYIGARAWDKQVSLRTNVDVGTRVSLIRREVFDRIGGFDTAFETMFAVRELSWRAREHGEVVLQPASVLYAGARPPKASSSRDCVRFHEKVCEDRRQTVVPEVADGATAALVVKAREAMAADRLDRAAEIVAELERVAPQQAETQLARGVLQLQLGNHDGALSTFRDAEVGQAADSRRVATFRDHRASLGVGLALVSSGRSGEAWDVISALASRHPEEPQVAHLLFRVGTQLENWSQLVDPLERYLKIVEDDLAIRFATASVCLRRGDYAGARRHYDELKGHDPGYQGLQDLARELTSSAWGG